MPGQARRLEQFADRVRLNLDYRQDAVVADGVLHQCLARASLFMLHMVGA